MEGHTRWCSMKKLLLLCLLFFSIGLNASICKGHFVNPITDICWDCLFPLTIGKSSVVDGHYPDTDNSDIHDYICQCDSDIGVRFGLAIGFWQPFSLVDVTRKPYCMVNLGGISLDMGHKGLGGAQAAYAGGSGAFYYVHWYKYPLMYWLNIITSLGCMQEDGFDILYPSELDPTWNDSTLALIMEPESLLFSNPIARFSCAADATTALTSTAIDKLFWCQGAQGSTYPLTGFVANQTGAISASLLLAERVNAKLHKITAIRDTVSEDSPKLCHTHKRVIMPKSRYRYQMVNTIADAKQCHPYGKSVLDWEAGHTVPNDGDNFGYLMWQKRNCCF